MVVGGRWSRIRRAMSSGIEAWIQASHGHEHFLHRSRIAPIGMLTRKATRLMSAILIHMRVMIRGPQPHVNRSV